MGKESGGGTVCAARAEKGGLVMSMLDVRMDKKVIGTPSEIPVHDCTKDRDEGKGVRVVRVGGVEIWMGATWFKEDGGDESVGNGINDKIVCGASVGLKTHVRHCGA